MTANADGLESLILVALQELFSDRPRIRTLLLRLGYVGADLDTLSTLGIASGQRLGELRNERLGSAYHSLISRIELTKERVKIVVRCEDVARFLAWDGIGHFRRDELQVYRSCECQIIDVPASVVRFRASFPVPIGPRDPGSISRPNKWLTKLIAQAREVQALVEAERELDPAALAQKANIAPWAFSRLLKLNYLAPDIIASILDGTQPAHLTKRLLMHTELPMDWALQRRMFGFPECGHFPSDDRIACGDPSQPTSFPVCARSDLRSDRKLAV